MSYEVEAVRPVMGPNVASAAAVVWAAGEVPTAPVPATTAAAVGAVASLATAMQRTVSVAAEAVNLTVIDDEVVADEAGWAVKVTAAAVAMVTLVETVPPTVPQ